MVWGFVLAIQSFAFFLLEKWDFLLFLWLMGENGPSREPRVSPATMQHAPWRSFSLLVGHPMERMVLNWVSPAGQALGTARQAWMGLQSTWHL